MRLLESLRLQVTDVGFERRELIVREGKGGKDRRNGLPENLMLILEDHLVCVEMHDARHLADGLGKVSGRLPEATLLKRGGPLSRPARGLNFHRGGRLNKVFSWHPRCASRAGFCRPWESALPARARLLHPAFELGFESLDLQQRNVLAEGVMRRNPIVKGQELAQSLQLEPSAHHHVHPVVGAAGQTLTATKSNSFKGYGQFRLRGSFDPSKASKNPDGSFWLFTIHRFSLNTV